MEYQVATFSYRERDVYEDFFNSLPRAKNSPLGRVSDRFWYPANYLGGFVLLAHTDEEVASTCFLTARILQVGDNLHNCYEIGGTNTLALHQRRGLFSKLVTQAVEIAFASQDIALIFGTPNDRSGPGYRKLGFDFDEQSESRLILFPNAARIVGKRLKLVDGKLKAKNQMGSVRIVGGIVVREIGCHEYIRRTKEFPRINHASDEYLERRLEAGQPSRRRFFHGSGRGQEIHLCLVPYELDYLQTVLVAEHFLNGRRDDTGAILQSAKAVAAAYFSGFEGVYMKSATPIMPNSRLLLTRGYLIHRKLPICHIGNPNYPQGTSTELLSKIVERFQMTDCDIG